MKNKMHMTRKTKDEKRRLAFEKRNVKKEQNLARYGAEGGSALVMAKTTDFNRRFVAAMLALVFAISCLVVGINFATKADNQTLAHDLKPEGANGVKDDSGMVLNKYLTAKENGNYDLTLEAYATAEVKPKQEKIPTDFVVVVDQSGSMDTTDMPTGNPTVQNNKYLEDIANGAYFYKDGDNYYRVYGVRDYLFRYYPANYWYVGDIVERLGQRLRWFMSNKESTASFSNQLYFRETVDGQTYYQPLTMTVRGAIGTYDVRFKYNSKTNGETWFGRNDETYMNGHQAPWYKNLAGGGLIDDNWGVTMFGRQIGYPQVDGIVQGMYTNEEEYCHSTFTIIPGLWKLETGMYVNYPMFDRHVGYTKLCYRDINGVEHEVPSNQSDGQSTWEFCDDDGLARSQQESDSDRPTYSGLYTFPSTTDRLTALKAALNEFAQAVANETDDFGAVNNRISIVGFSSMSSSITHDPDTHTNRSYNNTELLTHTERDISGTDGWQKNTCDNNVSEYYGKGLVASTNGSAGNVNSKISNAINALTANGGTQPEDGLSMAYQVLTNRGAGEGKTTYTIRSGKEKGQQVDRNTVVIFFTDGQPGNYHESNQYYEANEVVRAAKDIKDSGATLFSIGVFGESDGNPLTYDGKNDWTKDNQGNDVQVKSLDRGYWEYLGGWVETYYDEYERNYYCLRREWRPNSSEGYTALANDTIYDYMSVVSSNYPDAQDYIAPSWLNGDFSGNYIAATDGDAVRNKSTAEDTNKYYRMASNQDTLVAAFLQAVTMNNEESEHDAIPADSILLEDVISDSFSIKLNSENQPIIEYYQQKGEMGSDGLGIFDETVNPREPITNPGGEFSNNTLTVTNYDFSREYIASDKTEDNAGHKLIVVIKDVVPNSTVTSSDNTNPLYSNQEGAGINIIEDNAPVEELGVFPKPYISRHSYTMHVTGDDAAYAVFNVVPTLTGGGSSSTDDVILVTPTERIKYSKYVADGKPAFSMSDGDKFYFENVPSDYKVNTSITSTDGNYTYTWRDNSNATLDQTTAQSKPYDYVNSDFYIDSKVNTRSASLTLNTEGEYANKERQFPIGMTIVKNDGENFTGEITLGDNRTLSFTDGSLTNPDSLKLKDGDTVEFTNLPANSTVTITPSDDPGNAYTWTTQLDNGEVTNTSKTGTINQDGHVFHVVYIRGTVTDTGVSNDDSSHTLIYILAGAGALTAGAGAAYVYRKKDEFVER